VWTGPLSSVFLGHFFALFYMTISGISSIHFTLQMIKFLFLKKYVRVENNVSFFTSFSFIKMKIFLGAESAKDKEQAIFSSLRSDLSRLT
jgi:hypothetical protein